MVDRITYEMENMLPSADTEVRPEDRPFYGKDDFTAAKFASDSWQAAKERFMDAGKTDVDPDDPALFNAYKRAVDYLKDTGLAGLELSDAAFKFAVGAVSQVMPTEQQEKRMARDLYSMPDAFLGAAGAKSLTQLDDAVDTAAAATKQIASKIPEYDPTMIRAGFTGQNPPTYLKRNRPLSQQQTGLPNENLLIFREPIKEFAQTVNIPKKGLLGSEFIKLVEKNESIPNSSLQSGIIDPSKRYTREELWQALGGGSNTLGKNTFSTVANIASDKPTSFERYQRQKLDAGFQDVGRELAYFEIPIDSVIYGKGKNFEAKYQHFNDETIAHVRGSIVEPKKEGEVSSGYYELIGNKPFMLIEELQSDLLTKGYVKSKNAFENAFNEAVKDFNLGNEYTFNEAYGNATEEIKKTFKELDKLEEVTEPQRLMNVYSPDNTVFKEAKELEYIEKIKDNGYTTFEELKNYIDEQGTNNNHLDHFVSALERERRLGDWFTFEIIDNRTGKAYDNFVADYDDPTFTGLTREFLDYTKDSDLDYESLLEKYEDSISKYYEDQKAIFEKSGLSEDVSEYDLFYLYDHYKSASKILSPTEDVGLPPITKNKQAVEEALKAAIAKAAQQGVDKIVIPPAERIAEARNIKLKKDKGDRFYRTYVTDLNSALDDLKKNYPVKVYTEVELPYSNAVDSLLDEELNFDNVDFQTLDMALSNWATGETLSEAERWHLDTFMQNNDLTGDDDLLGIYREYERELNAAFENGSPVGRGLSAKGTVIDISELVDQYKVEEPRQFAEGGVVDDMDKQMKFAFMQEGGLTDDGTKVDPVSGNEVPAGSMAEEVRDDIPAQLSEGEYVVPADVVRYYGVKFFEDLRDQAKMGLTDMEANGRIGGEPTMIEGEISDEDFERALNSMNFAEGGFVGTNPITSQYPNYTTPGFSTVAPTSSYTVPGASTTPGYTPPPVPTATPQQQTGPVTLHGPGGEIYVLNLPADQQRYNSLMSQGYTLEPQVTKNQTPTTTSADQEGPDAGTGIAAKSADTSVGIDQEKYQSLFKDPLQFGKDVLAKKNRTKDFMGAASMISPAAGILGGIFGTGMAVNNIAEARAASIVAKQLGYDTTELDKSIESQIEDLPRAARFLAENAADGKRLADSYLKAAFDPSIGGGLSKEDFQTEEAFNTVMKEVAPEGMNYNPDTGTYTRSADAEAPGVQLGGTRVEDDQGEYYTPGKDTTRPVYRPDNSSSNNETGSGGLAEVGQAIKNDFKAVGKALGFGKDDEEEA